MFTPILAADPAPTWLALAIAGAGGIFGGAGLWGFLQSRVARKDAQIDAKAAERKDTAKADASVDAERVKGENAEKARYFDALREMENRRDADNKSLQAEMRQMRRTFGHELRQIQQYLTTLQDFYHACFGALTTLAMQCRIMRARLKRYAEAAGEKFDEDEFPLIDIAIHDPKLLPKFQPTNGWDEPEGDRSGAGRTMPTPNTQP